MAGSCNSNPLCARLVNAFLNYDTPKIVHISNKTVGLVNRVIQLAVILYIFLFVIWWKRGYQETEPATSATTTKLKGIAALNYSYFNVSIHGGANGMRIWDVADYVVPPQENDAFFITTNVIITPNQTQARCPEDYRNKKAYCKNDSQCVAGEPVFNGNGIMTGKCVTSDRNKSVNVCEIYGWCPVEYDEMPIHSQVMLEDSAKFTVFIKNYIEFPKFQVKRRNILDNQDNAYISKCRYSKDKDALCPVFNISTITTEAGVKNYDDIAMFGGVINIYIRWDCNLDIDISNCVPEYSFSRLDESSVKAARGNNFRYASFYDQNGVLYRDLFKVFGIRFILKVSGSAGKFSVVPLLLNVGSGIGLLAVASVVSDIIMMHVLKERHIYKKKKYLVVDGETDNAPGNADDDDEDDDNSVSPRRRRAGAAVNTPYERLEDDSMLNA